MTEYEGTEQAIEFKDRKTSLVVLGVIQIIIGSFCALMVPLMIMGMIALNMAGKDGVEGPKPGAMIIGFVFYALLAVWFIWMGIGSIKARRWARAIILITSWMWLICGLLGFIFILMVVPSIYDQMGQDERLPEGVAVVMQIVMLVFMSVIYIIIPGLFVLCYKGKNVKATCEYRDPKVRWTDKCPLPVLGVSLVCAVWAVSIPLTVVNNRGTVPFFGVLLGGVTGAIVILALSLLLAYSAWSMYKLDINGWWCGLLVNVGWSLSSIITLSCVSMESYFEKTGVSEQQMESMKNIGIIWKNVMAPGMVFWLVVVLAYFIYIRKYFVSNISDCDNHCIPL